MEILVNETPRRIWDRATADAAYQQNWAYGAACAALGSRVLRVELRRDGVAIGFAQAVHRRLFGCLEALVCTRGPVWVQDTDADTRRQALAALRQKLAGGWLKGLFLTPEADSAEEPVLQQARLAKVMTPYSTAVLDLSLPEPDLRAAQNQKWRNRLVVAERSGLTVGRADRRPDLYLWLLEEEARQQRARRYAALPPALVPAWQQASGGLRVFTARKGDDTVAAMLFLVHGRRATYHLGWSSPEGKRTNAHNLTLWQAIRKLKARGLGQIDLGGLNTEDVPGIARFKLGSGARVKTLCGTWFGR